MQNDYDALAPKGFSENCNRHVNSTDATPHPLAWFEKIKSKGSDIQFELVDGGGHGMMFDSGDARTRLEKRVIAFLESKL